MQHGANEVVVLLSLELFLLDFHVVIILVHEHVVKSQEDAGGNDTGGTSDEDGPERLKIPFR